MSFIKFENVSYKIENETILKNINFEIEKGEFVAIIGANASGKSTLAKLINGLILPSEGRILVNNLNTKNIENLQKIHQTIGIVFQNPDNQIIATTVEDDIAFGPENLNIDANETETRIDKALNLVGLTDKRKFSPYMLSGGQKQKVAIAGVLAMNTEAIIFDEATSMLDPKSKKEVFNKILELNKKNKITIIYISHFMEEILNADKIIVLNKGEIQRTGNLQEIFSDTNIKNLNLDLPFFYKLAKSLNEKGIQLSNNFIDEKSLISELVKIKVDANRSHHALPQGD